jgi:hypothetical protein
LNNSSRVERYAMTRKSEAFNEFILVTKQEGHDGPNIAHLNTNTLNDKEQIIIL